MARRKKQDEDPSDENVNNNNDDTFGLPEIEYQPLQREEPPATEPEPEPEPASQPTSDYEQTHNEMEREVQQNEYNTSNYYNDDDDGNSPWPKILGIAAFLLLAAAAIWYFAVYQPNERKAAEKARQEQEAEEARQREADMAEQRRIEEERRKADSIALANAVPPTGVIDTLTERTGRYYVIIASGIDGDLIMDYAKKLAPKGLNPKIIPPHGNVKFYRLAIAEGDTYASTQATADQLKAEYSGGAWVVKY